MNKDKVIYLQGHDLLLSEVIEVAEKGCKVDFSEELKNKIAEFRTGLEKQLTDHPEIQIYGTNVGCGDLKDVKITPEAFEEFQVKYIKAHNCGTGAPLSIAEARGIMVIRLNSFAKGLSAVRRETCQLMIDMLNKGVTPWILEEGSVGASGDLIPLAMMAAVMIGLPEAKAYFNGELLPATVALEKAGLQPTRLGAKEAMGITNGSNYISSLAIFALRDAENLLKTASVATALSLEAIRGEKDAFCELIHENRPHKGQLQVATQIRKLVNGSKRTTKEAQLFAFPHQSADSVKERVQDRYSFRATPQVNGAAIEAIDKLKDVLTIELNSATDNPLFYIDENGTFLAKSGANFHGQPLATVIDYAKLSLTSIGLMSDKRSFSLLNKALNFGLPADLAVNHAQGDSGLMLTQYAGAARVAENRVLSTPASVMSVSTSANQEDVVSMGSIGVVHLKRIIYNLQLIVAIELLNAQRAIQMTYNLLPSELQSLGEGTSIVYNYLNQEFAPMTGDEYLRTDMEKMLKIVQENKIVELVANFL